MYGRFERCAIMTYNDRKDDEETVSVVRVCNIQRDENYVTKSMLSMPEMKRRWIA